jgi:hypothetical protein
MVCARGREEGSGQNDPVRRNPAGRGEGKRDAMSTNSWSWTTDPGVMDSLRSDSEDGRTQDADASEGWVAAAARKRSCEDRRLGWERFKSGSILLQPVPLSTFDPHSDGAREVGTVESVPARNTTEDDREELRVGGREERDGTMEALL